MNASATRLTSRQERAGNGAAYTQRSVPTGLVPSPGFLSTSPALPRCVTPVVCLRDKALRSITAVTATLLLRKQQQRLRMKQRHLQQQQRRQQQQRQQPRRHQHQLLIIQAVFPSSSETFLKNGESVKMSDLKIGDMVEAGIYVAGESPRRLPSPRSVVTVRYFFARHMCPILGPLVPLLPLLWVSKPEWVLPYSLVFAEANVMYILISTSGATTADLLMAGIAAIHFPTYMGRSGTWLGYISLQGY